jgi:radical SAM superfamily enzyme
MEEKRYHLYSNQLKGLFGRRVHKISVDAGFGCPNRAGDVTRAAASFAIPPVRGPSASTTA